ncbi:pyridoxal phosphate-dependent aminotransferase [Clostridium thermarum]|uniref:pyridoxal phosphate-dependent aminotransferase n=1 Tax=Clostridium thermarum TaxID=1716543 RepID=UPI001120BFDA|nr:pyridoxal phosphate-dependent aminotransferase [Clostridium thermarum]
MEVSNRIKKVLFSPIRKLTPYAEIARKKGVKIYHLNIGQPDIETPQTFFYGVDKFKEKVLQYSNSNGEKILLESFSLYYKKLNFDLDPKEIMVTNGGSEAILFTLMAVCDIGDNIIIPEPFYTNYRSIAAACGVEVRTFTTLRRNGFHLPHKEVITELITPKTKAIIFSNPGNPTGVVYTKEEVTMLAGIAKEYNLYIISDEVYREFVYDGLKHTSILEYDEIKDRAILIDSISKRYSACGARVGLTASKNPEFNNEILKMCQLRLSSPTLEQFGAANLINTPPEYFVNVRNEYTHRRDVLYEELIKIPGVECKKPEGAFYIIAKLPVEDAEEFSKWMLSEYSLDNETVMVAPAEGFYLTPNLGKDEIRISYCLESDALIRAINILKKALMEFSKRT